jgi:hypothetical protein
MYLLEVMFVFPFLDLVCLTVVAGFMQLVISRHFALVFESCKVIPFYLRVNGQYWLKFLLYSSINVSFLIYCVEQCSTT